MSDSKPHSEPPVMATDFAIVVSGLGLVGDGYDDERGAALHRIRDRMANLEEQNESLLRDNETLGVLNETLKEQLAAYEQVLRSLADDKKRLRIDQGEGIGFFVRHVLESNPAMNLSDELGGF